MELHATAIFRRNFQPMSQVRRRATAAYIVLQTPFRWLNMQVWLSQRKGIHPAGDKAAVMIVLETRLNVSLKISILEVF